MKRTGLVRLAFNPQPRGENDESGEAVHPPAREKPLNEGLSVVVQIGKTLWVTNDETVTVERLTLVNEGTPAGISARDHRQFRLQDYLRLPVAPSSDPDDVEEADLEGLAYDNGYLWLVGSHSLKRVKPKRGDTPGKAQKQLARVRRDGNRYLLARIPVVVVDGAPTLVRHSLDGEDRVAAQLRGDDAGNDLTEALRNDEHLGPSLQIPGKENGFDIEGLAVTGARLLLGLRGPVLRGWAVILEVEPRGVKGRPSLLKLRKMGPKDRLYRKHLLDLGGLGIRDLCVDGADLLILAGPTMSHDGPVSIFRWPGGAAPPDDSLVSASELKLVLEVPYGQGNDRAEGLALFTLDGGQTQSLLVVYDAASPDRQPCAHTIEADLFAIG